MINSAALRNKFSPFLKCCQDYEQNYLGLSSMVCCRLFFSSDCSPSPFPSQPAILCCFGSCISIHDPHKPACESILVTGVFACFIYLYNVSGSNNLILKLPYSCKLYIEYPHINLICHNF